MMESGEELDRLVAQIMDTYEVITQEDVDDGSFSPLGTEFYEDYSTDFEAAMMAFDWLVWNNPWTKGNSSSFIVIGWRGGPSVMVIKDTGFPILPYGHQGTGGNFYILGESYPHAIALAVLEAGKAKK